jgi:hypothetical protein
MHGRHRRLTAGQTDPWLAARQACATAGLDATGARLIHHCSNAIYLLPAENAVARVTHGHDAAERITASQLITRWLAQHQGFLATQPAGGTTPVTVNDAVVSFWTYYPQPEPAPELTSRHLAVLLRLLHHAGTPPIALPDWMPLTSLHATVTDPVLSAALTTERAGLDQRPDHRSAAGDRRP